jgi:hypothetical protein
MTICCGRIIFVEPLAEKGYCHPDRRGGNCGYFQS